MKENSESRPIKFRLKTKPVSHPARAEGLLNTHITGKREKGVHNCQIRVRT